MTALDERQFLRGAVTLFRTWPSPLPDSSWSSSESQERQDREINIAFRGPKGESLALPVWAKELQIELNAILALPDRWDGHLARAVTQLAAAKMARLLGLVMDDSIVRPQLFPLPDGGVQAEWRAGEHQVEVDIDGRGEPYAAATPPIAHGHDPEFDLVVPEPGMSFDELDHAYELSRALATVLRRLTDHVAAYSAR